MSPHAEALLERHFEVCRPYRSQDPDAALEQAADRITVAAVGAAAGFPERLWSALPRLELIVVHGVGEDRVDQQEARRRRVAVQFTPHVLAEDVADLAIGLWLALSRRLVDADRHVRLGHWRAGTPFPLTRQASGQRVGVVGMGHIGAAIARRLEGFGARIAYTALSPKPDRPYFFADSVRELAAMSDALFIAAPGGAETQHMIGWRELEALGPDGLLINVARGSLVDEGALIDALRRGRLGGAALDVFAQEPSDGARFAGLDNVILQPHLGSATQETRRLMARILVDQIEEHFNRRKGRRSA